MSGAAERDVHSHAMDWRVRTFSELTNQELYELLQLRTEVFVVEQDCVFQDMDDVDQESVHLLGYDAAGLVAYLRWYEGEHGLQIGRVVTTRRVRGTGVGHAIMSAALVQVGDRASVVHAQSHLHDYYAAHGFVSFGDEFLEDGIPHISMRRAANTAT